MFFTKVLLFLSASNLIAGTVYAYPNFISYGYGACITCHYNGAGGGALNDYGKALFATEFTSRAVFSKRRTEESIGERSGLFGWQSPHWFKPGLKFRGLWLQTNPGKETEYDKLYEMQYDVNVTSSLNENDKYLMSGTLSYLPTPRIASTYSDENPAEWFLKEFYLRLQTAKSVWIYLGLLDKVYGIRHANHTAYNRGSLGLGQFDQSLGGVLQVTQKKWELFLGGFAGHPKDETEKQQKGGSVNAEFMIKDHSRVGGSLLVSSDETKTWMRLGPHFRSRIGKGNSLLTEIGIKEDITFEPFERQKGPYLFSEFVGRIARGYNYQLNIEYFDRDDADSKNYFLRSAIGFLMFPLPGTEFRLNALNSQFTDEESTTETWSLQSQLHLSW